MVRPSRLPFHTFPAAHVCSHRHLAHYVAASQPATQSTTTDTGQPSFAVLVPDVAKACRLVAGGTFRPLLQFAFRRLSGDWPEWGIVTLRWSTLKEKYVLNCEICNGGGGHVKLQSCVHRSLIYAAAFYNPPAALECPVHSLLRTVLSRPTQTDASVMGGSGAGPVKTAPVLSLELRLRFLNGAAYRFVHFAASDPEGGQGVTESDVVRDSQKRDQFEARAAARAYDEDMLADWFSVPQHFSDTHQYQAGLHSERHVVAVHSSRCNTVQWLHCERGQLQPFVGSHLPAQCDAPLLFAAALDLGQAADCPHGQGLWSALNTDGIWHYYRPVVEYHEPRSPSMLDHRNLFSSAQARDCSEIHEHLRELGLDATSLDNSELLVASELVYLARSSGTNALAQLASAYAMFDLMDRGQSTDTSIPEELSWTKRGLRILEEAHQVCYSEERSAKVSAAPLCTPYRPAQAAGGNPDTLEVGEFVIYSGGSNLWAARILARTDVQGVAPQEVLYSIDTAQPEASSMDALQVKRADLHRWRLPAAFYAQLGATWPRAAKATKTVIPLAGEVEFCDTNKSLIFHPLDTTGLDPIRLDPATCRITVATPLIFLHCLGTGEGDPAVLRLCNPAAEYDTLFCHHIAKLCDGAVLNAAESASVAICVAQQALAAIMATALPSEDNYEYFIDCVAQWAPSTSPQAVHTALHETTILAGDEASHMRNTDGADIDGQRLLVAEAGVMICHRSIYGMTVTHIFAYDAKVSKRRPLPLAYPPAYPHPPNHPYPTPTVTLPCQPTRTLPPPCPQPALTLSSAYPQPTLSLPSAYHQPTTSLPPAYPSAYHQPTTSLPPAYHQPTPGLPPVYPSKLHCRWCSAQLRPRKMLAGPHARLCYGEHGGESNE